MLDGVDNSPKIDISHVLTLEIVGFSQLSGEEQAKVMAELNGIVRAGIRFSVADAARKVVSTPRGDGMTLIFSGDASEAMECAVEIATDLEKHPELKLRMGLHGGPVKRMVDLDGQHDVTGDAVDMAERVIESGDSGHILLSKRIAYELAASERWNAHLFELGDRETPDGQKISLVNYYTEKIGNSEVPAKIRRERDKLQARERRSRLVRRSIFSIAVMAVAVIIAFAIVFVRRELADNPSVPVPEKGIAVLPFVDLSQARDQEYFCDGVSEEILNALAKVPGLRVVSRASSFTFKDKNAGLNEIGHKLNVEAVLQGEMRREGNQVHVKAQLIDIRTGSELWSNEVDKEMPGVLALEDEITKSVVRGLRVRFKMTGRERVLSNAAAYDVYLQGLSLSNKGDEANLRKSLEVFQRALDEDPRLARAWTGIARNWFQLADAQVKPMEAYPRVRAAAEKALALDQQDAEAHCYLGETKRVLDWDIAGEEAELKRALEIQPSLDKAHSLLGLLRGCVGDAQENLAQSTRAASLNPLSPATANALVNAFIGADRLDEALAEARRIIDIDPNYFYFEPALALVYQEQGKLKEALEIYQRLEQSRKNPTSGLAITYAQLGRMEDAGRVLDQLIQRTDSYYFSGDQIAAVYAALGEYDQAFRWLDRAVEEHSPTVHRVAFAHEFRPLHSDPRFPNVLRRIGLDPAKFKKK